MTPGAILIALGTILMFATPALRMIEQRHAGQRTEQVETTRDA